MNAPDRKFMNAGDCPKGAWFLGVAVLATLLSGCTGLVASVKVDPNSAIAPEVAKLASADKDYPSFNEIPPKPTDLQSPKVYGARAGELLTARAQLDAATTPNTWTLGNTTSFLARAQADAGPALGPPTNADTEAFAKAIRKRATPPPLATH